MNLGTQGNAFRIVAPGAFQATALKKHGGPQPRSVFCGHALDFEDEASTFILSRDIVHDIDMLNFAIIKLFALGPCRAEALDYMPKANIFVAHGLIPVGC